MNNKALTLSLVMAILAVFFVQSYVSSVEEEATKKYGTAVLVVVAKKDIKEMDTINETMLEFKSIPKKFQEPSAIVLEDADLNKDNDKEKNFRKKTLAELAGTIALVPIKQGEQITYNKLTDPSLRTGLAPQITPGRRAIAVPVNEITGVSKLIKPGDRVDLIAVLDAGSGKENRIAKTVLQDVAVLSIGRYVTNNAARAVEADAMGGKDKIRSLAEDFSFASVTLEVEPAQAQALALVMSNSDNAITLALRNNDDTDRINYPATTLLDILGSDAARVRGGVFGRR